MPACWVPVAPPFAANSQSPMSTHAHSPHAVASRVTAVSGKADFTNAPGCAPVPACLVRRRSPRCFSSFLGGGMISQLHIAIGYRWPGCLAFASSCRISSTASASKSCGAATALQQKQQRVRLSFCYPQSSRTILLRCEQRCSHRPSPKQHVKQADTILQPAESLTSQQQPDTLYPEIVLAAAMKLSIAPAECLYDKSM